jgi:hypothetical protein
MVAVIIHYAHYYALEVISPRAALYSVTFGEELIRLRWDPSHLSLSHESFRGLHLDHRCVRCHGIFTLRGLVKHLRTGKC